MPLQREVDYWDAVASALVNDHKCIKDNVWKRPQQIRRLLKYDWLGQSVLEIGTWNGMIAGSLKLILEGHWEYIGT